jgi:hypothetical protein
MNTVIVDLDNCISDDSWRIPHINWQKSNPLERYHDYHSLAAFDRIGNEDIIFSARAGVDQVVIFTARPVMYRAATEEWLRRNNVPFKYLIMRNNNDHRPSLELKRSMLHWLPELYDVPWHSIVGAYDDRPDVVEMYRKHHMPGYLRSIHDVCAYTPPPVNTNNTITVSAQ